MEKNEFKDNVPIEKDDKAYSAPEELFRASVMSLVEKNEESVNKSIMIQMLEQLKEDINGNIKKR